MTMINPGAASTLPLADPPTALDSPTSPGLTETRDICGRLKVQVGGTWSQAEMAQLERAVRKIDSTAIGRELLHNIANCDIPPLDPPVLMFQGITLDDTRSEFELALTSVGHVIKFRPYSPEQTNRLERLEQISDLFSGLAEFYAARLGEPCPAPEFGFGRFSTLTMREQLGEYVPRWQHDLQTYIYAASDAQDDRVAVCQQIINWLSDGDPDAPLGLASKGLTECPPLQNLADVKWIILSNNRIRTFPPADRLPDTIERLDLVGNPLQGPPRSYPTDLVRVTIGGPNCATQAIQQAAPVGLEIVEADETYMRHMDVASHLFDTFPTLAGDFVHVDEMERNNLTDDIMRDVYVPDMLEKAVGSWLYRPNGSWRRAQQAQPNASRAFTALLRRMHKAKLGERITFQEKMAELLRKMQQPGNEAFQDRCLQLAREGSESCTDRMVVTLNDLHMAALDFDVEAGAYDKRLPELLRLGEGMFGMRLLVDYTVQLMPELDQRARANRVARGLPAGETDRADQIEQYLMLQSSLRDRLNLPLLASDIEYGTLSFIRPDDVVQAAAYIESRRQTGMLDFLAEWPPMQSVIRRNAPGLQAHAQALRDHLFNDRGRVYHVLDRLLKKDGQLFARDNDLFVFNVPYRMFWTPYERLVAGRLKAQGLQRSDTDSVVQVCKVVSDDLQRLIHRQNVAAFLASHGVPAPAAPTSDTPIRLPKRLRTEAPPRRA